MKYFILLLFLLVGCGTKNGDNHIPPVNNTQTQKAELAKWTDWVLGKPEANKGTFGSNANSDDPSLKNTLAFIGMDFEKINQMIDQFIEHTSLLVKNQKKWLGNEPPEDFYKLNTAINTDDHPFKFAQKAIFPKNSKIVVMGDFHGSLHSLIRNLWRLKEQGHISEDLIISKDTYFVFNGDFVDRGRYGTEVVYTLLRLKLKNPNNVYLLRGNHELSLTSYDNGLLRELIGKYGDDKGKNLYTKMINMFRFLPVVLLIGVKKTNKGYNFVQFCHGGFSYDGLDFLYKPKKLILDKTGKAFEEVKVSLGFMWSDFGQVDGFKVSPRLIAPEDGVVVIGPNLLDKYLKENNLQAIFRGHQDMDRVLKVLASHSVSKDKKDILALDHTLPATGELGPYDWADTLASLNNKDNNWKNGLRKLAYKEGIKIFSFNNLANVFTFTTALEGRGAYLDFEGFGLLETSNNFKEWNMKINEHELKDRKEEFFTDIIEKPIDFKFKIVGPGRIL